jgi:hypothetical protein
MLRKLTQPVSWHFEWLKKEPGNIETPWYRNYGRAMAQMLLRDEKSFSGMCMSYVIDIVSVIIEDAKLLGGGNLSKYYSHFNLPFFPLSSLRHLIKESARHACLHLP